MVPDGRRRPRPDRRGGRPRRGFALGDQRTGRDPATEGGRPSGRRRRPRGDRAPAFSLHGHPGRTEGRDDRAVEIRPEHTGTRCDEPIERRRRGVSIRVPRASRGHRDSRPYCIDERLRRRRLAAVVCDLQEVEPRESLLEQRRVDRLLDVARQQHPVRTHGAQQDDRDVVDPGPAVGRLGRHMAADGPQHAEVDLVDRQSVAAREPEPDRRGTGRQSGEPGGVARPGSAHARLEHLSDAVSVHQSGEPGHVVLVRVRQDHRVDAPVPRWDPRIEVDQQPGWVRAAIDQQPAAARTLDEDRVTLADVHHGDARDAARTTEGHRTADRDADGEEDDGEADGARCRRGRSPCDGAGIERRAEWRRRQPAPHPRPASANEDDREDGPGGDRPGDRCREGHARERDRCGRIDDRDHQSQRDPARDRQDGPDRGRSAGEDQPAAEQRDEAGSHRRGDQRDDDEVHDRREDREPSERHQDHGQGRELGCQRHPEALGEPARDSAAAEPLDRGGRRRGPGDESGGREGRELESGIADEARIGDQEDRGGPAERGRRPSGATRLARQQHDPGHRPGADHRRGGAREDHVDDDRGHRHDRSTPPTHPPGDRRDGRSHDRDVPPGDGDDVAHAGGREGRGQVTVDPVSQADQDPGREASLRLGQDHGQRGRRSLSDVLDGVAGVDRPRRDVDRARRDGADDPDPLEVVAVGRIGSWPDRRAQRDDVARHDRGVGGERRRHAEAGRDRIDRSGAWRSGSRRERPRWPRPRTSRVRGPPGRRPRTRLRRRPAAVPGRGRRPTRTTRPVRSTRSARSAHAAMTAASRARSGRPPTDQETVRRRPRGGDRPRRPASRCAASHPTVTSGLSWLEGLLADELARPQVIDRGERAVRLARRDDLGGGHRPDPGERLELRAGGAVEVDDRGCPAARIAPAGRARAAVAGARSSRDGTRTWSPSLRIAARFSDPARPVSTLGPNPPATSTRSPTRAPTGSRKTPGRSTAPTISTTTTAPASAAVGRGAGAAGTRRSARVPTRRSRRASRRSRSRRRPGTTPRRRDPPRRRWRAPSEMVGLGHVVPSVTGGRIGRWAALDRAPGRGRGVQGRALPGGIDSGGRFVGNATSRHVGGTSDVDETSSEPYEGALICRLSSRFG